jgi:hypothetical protein
VRAACYERLDDPRAARAQRDLARFRAQRVPSLQESLRPGVR